jgi:hypothetical protein
MSNITAITTTPKEKTMSDTITDEEAAHGLTAAEREARRAAQERAMHARLARERDVAWLRGRIGAEDNPWIQAQIAKLEKKVKAE